MYYKDLNFYKIFSWDISYGSKNWNYWYGWLKKSAPTSFAQNWRQLWGKRRFIWEQFKFLKLRWFWNMKFSRKFLKTWVNRFRWILLTFPTWRILKGETFLTNNLGFIWIKKLHLFFKFITVKLIKYFKLNIKFKIFLVNLTIFIKQWSFLNYFWVLTWLPIWFHPWLWKKMGLPYFKKWEFLSVLYISFWYNSTISFFFKYCFWLFLLYWWWWSIIFELWLALTFCYNWFWDNILGIRFEAWGKPRTGKVWKRWLIYCIGGGVWWKNLNYGSRYFQFHNKIITGIMGLRIWIGYWWIMNYYSEWKFLWEFITLNSFNILISVGYAALNSFFNYLKVIFWGCSFLNSLVNSFFNFNIHGNIIGLLDKFWNSKIYGLNIKKVGSSILKFCDLVKSFSINDFLHYVYWSFKLLNINTLIKIKK